MDPFTVASRRRADWSVVEVTGELDIATRDRLRDHLYEVIAAHRPAHVIVDLSRLEFCDATGLSVLVAGQHRVWQHDGRLRLVCPEGRIRRLLRLTRLIDVFPVYETLTEAATAVGGRRQPDGHRAPR
ncbi:STAS domain-containing protein [Streptomyces sp.]|uniref:STAS domain-containing protein n=1 Tax=Streptomyces sp. TaxID=1931 RepID=UPI002F404FA1